MRHLGFFRLNTFRTGFFVVVAFLVALAPGALLAAAIPAPAFASGVPSLLPGDGLLGPQSELGGRIIQLPPDSITSRGEVHAAVTDFAFTTVAGNVSTCQLASGSIGYALMVMACRNGGAICFGDMGKITANAINGSTFTLNAGTTYYLSSSAVKAISDSYFGSNGSYPNQIVIRQVYCNGVGGATVGNLSGYTATCSSSGCSTLSSAIGITFP